MIKRMFTREEEKDKDNVVYKKYDIVIKKQNGEVIFSLPNAEFPESWNENTRNIVASRYFSRGEKKETSVKQIIHRVVDTISNWISNEKAKHIEDIDVFSKELHYILLHQMACFNSPVWFNMGISDPPQTSACFILEVEDTIESLLELQETEVKVAKKVVQA